METKIKQLSTNTDLPHLTTTCHRLYLNACSFFMLQLIIKPFNCQPLISSFLAVILPEENLEEIIGTLSEVDKNGWQANWVVRYSVIVKCRGVIKNKG